ncbi:MAG: hypothetical protein HY852_23845 [Bradyrhizobium sp.]|uniref:hypothetical protein n=1 Tax=Bradyrhizobium sp. TaxID=376 RepID=UPI0025C1A6EA|nr:hypothetical protein [Bradyrhizobium sp.]MBI5264840.1 hypothetical protein [Bradyrhizobium sp.]
MTDSGNKGSNRPVRRLTGIDVVSAVKMSEQLTAAVDAWAESHETHRSDAIRQLVEIGLAVSNAAKTASERDSARIEQIAVRQIDQLLDPALPEDERERRIRRLTEGPPEFAPSRVDLPKPET